MLNEEKIDSIAVACIGIFFLVVCLVGLGQDYAYAAQGQKDIGNVWSNRKVTGSSFTGTALWGPAPLRYDSSCRNNDSTTIWIGSVTTTIHGETHPNVAEGYPVLSSEPFNLGGKFTGIGPAYMTCSPGVAACEMRCADTQEK